MKLYFKVLATSTLPPSVVQDKIIMLLKLEHYIVKNRTSNTISFKDDKWDLRPRSYYFKKVDTGVFEVTIKSEGSQVIYTYGVSYIIEGFISIVTIIGFSTISDFALIIGLGFWLQFAVKIYKLKGVAKNLLEKITN